MDWFKLRAYSKRKVTRHDHYQFIDVRMNGSLVLIV